VIGRQLADGELDPAQRFLGRCVVDRRNGGERLAAIAHPLARQHMFSARDRKNAKGFVAFGASDDRFDARQFRRLGHVDVEDFRMRIGTAENPPGQHSWQDQIGGIFGAPGNFFRAVDHRHVAADIMRRHDLVHGVNPAAQSTAACFTASMIFT
jgi:hypothetical protein